MQNLTPEGLRIVTDVATRHRVSLDAAITLLGALAQGNGRQAQFNHPDLGGMGQWSQGGMIMIGDMFNQGLKHRVDLLCREIASLLRCQPSLNQPDASHSQSQGQSGGYTALVYSYLDPAGPRVTGGRPNSAAPPRPARRITCNMPASRSLAASQSGRATG